MGEVMRSADPRAIVEHILSMMNITAEGGNIRPEL
jgi:hypothetical protein